MLSVRTKNEEEELIKAYARMHGMSVSDFLKRTALEKIEDEYDLKLYHEALEEFKENPVTYTLEEVEKEMRL